MKEAKRILQEYIDKLIKDSTKLEKDGLLQDALEYKTMLIALYTLKRKYLEEEIKQGSIK